MAKLKIYNFIYLTQSSKGPVSIPAMFQECRQKRCEMSDIWIKALKIQRKASSSRSIFFGLLSSTSDFAPCRSVALKLGRISNIYVFFLIIGFNRIMYGFCLAAVIFINEVYNILSLKEMNKWSRIILLSISTRQFLFTLHATNLYQGHLLMQC